MTSVRERAGACSGVSATLDVLSVAHVGQRITDDANTAIGGHVRRARMPQGGGSPTIIGGGPTNGGRSAKPLSESFGQDELLRWGESTRLRRCGVGGQRRGPAPGRLPWRGHVSMTCADRRMGFG